ncbi:MAG: hypothetical protein JW829_02360 [Pirellulales bacterium]|nr:hypothetical protein [Pirellulales bacterium]
MPHPYGWLSLLPPLVAIVLAIASRRVVVSLLAGILTGAMILRRGNPFLAIADTFEQHLWPTATDQTNLRIFAFTLLMGGMVAVVSRAGGMQGLINLVTPWAKDRRRGQLATWLAGLFIFFDDYANSIVLGNTLRGLTDRLRISREKLSFLVDATAAPVAGIVPLSTWVAVEIAQIAEGLKNAGAAEDMVPGVAFELFLWSIPYRFYAIWMLVLIPLIAILLRDFGPMHSAEHDMVTRGTSRGKLITFSAGSCDVPALWYNAALPIGITLGVLIGLIYQTGYAACLAKCGADGFAALQAGERIREILGESDSPLALAYGALAGLATIAGMARWQRILSWNEISETTAAGMKTVFPALAILVTAMTLSGMTKGDRPKAGEMEYSQKETRLYTGVYLGRLLLGEKPGNTPQVDNRSRKPGEDDVRHERGVDTDPTPKSVRRQWLTRLLPTIVFLLAAVVAFCTGTSYGTMGILMPMTIALAYSVLGSMETVDVGHPILLGAVGGVLAGSIFGDHCSPISDTTVLSSQASGCHHIAHVWTQMPYAILIAAVAVLCGTLPLGFGVSLWILHPMGVIAMILVLFLLGRPIPEREL